MSIRIGVAAAVLLFGFCPAVLADGDRGKTAHRHRHAHVVEYAEPVAPQAGFSGGRLVTHPAWTFACEGAYGPNRGPACDIPVWVYGNPCEVGVGWGRSRPCNQP